MTSNISKNSLFKGGQVGIERLGNNVVEVRQMFLDVFRRPVAEEQIQ